MPTLRFDKAIELFNCTSIFLDTGLGPTHGAARSSVTRAYHEGRLLEHGTKLTLSAQRIRRGVRPRVSRAVGDGVRRLREFLGVELGR